MTVMCSTTCQICEFFHVFPHHPILFVNDVQKNQHQQPKLATLSALSLCMPLPCRGSAALAVSKRVTAGQAGHSGQVADTHATAGKMEWCSFKESWATKDCHGLPIEMA